MRPTAKGGYGFNFSCTLCSAHFATCALFTFLFMKKKKAAPSPAAKDHTIEDGALDRPRAFKLPIMELVTFLVVNDLSIIFLNLSLLLNSVFVYQIFKLGIVPFVATVEYAFFGNRLTQTKLVGIAVVMGGIFLVVNPGSASSNILPTAVGLLAACGSVVCAGMQQISTRHLQKKYNIPPVELLDSISLTMALTLGTFGPVLDRFISGRWVWEYEFSAPAIK